MPFDILHRHHGFLETALLPGLGGAFLALDRIGIDVGTREAVARGDEIGGDALRQEIVRHGDGRIHGPGAARRADADPAHRFGAAADRHVLLAGHDLRRGEIDRVEAGRAEAVDLHTRHAVAVTGHERRSAREVGGGLAHRIDHAHHHVVDQHRIELIAARDLAERLRRQIERGDLVQRAVGLAATTRRADVIVDEGVGHARFSLMHKLRAIRSFMISLVPA